MSHERQDETSPHPSRRTMVRRTQTMDSALPESCGSHASPCKPGVCRGFGLRHLFLQPIAHHRATEPQFQSSSRLHPHLLHDAAEHGHMWNKKDVTLRADWRYACKSNTPRLLHESMPSRSSSSKPKTRDEARSRPNVIGEFRRSESQH